MSEQRILHFTFGAPQEFISQARRTRDLWAGSYIMSYLAGVAIRALEKANSDEDGSRTVIFPAVKDDPLMQALRGKISPSKDADVNTPEYRANRIGSLPNRFSAIIDNTDINGSICTNAINEAWKDISNTVLAKITEWSGKYFSNKTLEIWNRQIENTWECMWVIGDDHRLLDQRKCLRTHFPPKEEGEKCTICGMRQALSGEDTSRKEVRCWWGKVAESFNDGGLHFRKEGRERLCAVCTVKRIFPLVNKNFIGVQSHNYPSTSYLAAIDWIAELLAELEKEDVLLNKAISFIEATNKACSPKEGRGEIATKVCGIHEKLEKLKDKYPDHYQLLNELANLDGDFFFPDALRNEKEFLTHLPKQNNQIHENRKKVLDALGKLTSTDKINPPTPFYALLLMDGDNMGRILNTVPTNMEKKDHQKQVSLSLAEFTRQVPDIVYQANGALVYAGGDDVFAFLPLNTALVCAQRLRLAYQAAFLKFASHITDASISAAVVYAHMNTALGVVVKDAHKLLDDVAKDRTGRNAFAVRVWKRGGPVVTFAKPWCGTSPDWIGELTSLKESFKKQEYSSGFFYRMRELFEILESDKNEPPLFEYEQQVQLLTAEYMKNRNKPSLTRNDAEERVSRLLKLCRQEYREGVDIKTDRLEADGSMLLRFLEQKEV